MLFPAISSLKQIYLSVLELAFAGLKTGWFCLLPSTAVPSASSPFKDAKGCMFPCAVVLLKSLSKSKTSKRFLRVFSIVTNEKQTLLTGSRSVTRLEKEKKKKVEETFCVSIIVLQV